MVLTSLPFARRATAIEVALPCNPISNDRCAGVLRIEMFRTEVIFTTPDGFELKSFHDDFGTVMRDGGRNPSPDDCLLQKAKEILIRQGKAKEEDFEAFSYRIEREVISNPPS